MAMNNKRVFFAVFVFSAFFIAGCGSTIPSLKPYHVEVQQGNVVDEKMLAQLHPGMTKSQVRFVLGTPLIQDDFHQNRWDYFYQIRKDGKIVDRRSVVLDFEGDALKGIRGDVVPANSTSAIDSASSARLSAEPKGAPKPAEEKGFWDSLKFWESNDQPAIKVEPKKPTEVSKPEESKKSFWDRLKFWEGDEKTAPKSDKSSDATIMLLNKTVMAHQLLRVGVTASEVAEVSQQKEEVTAAVNAWADAWRKKDVKRYLAAYAEQFVPEGFSSKKAWATQRKQRILQAGTIKLDLENMNVELADQLAIVTFNQNYTKANFTDHVTKTLQLIYADNRWLILKESISDAGASVVTKVDVENSTSKLAEHSEGSVSQASVASAPEPNVQVEPKSEVVKPDSAKPESNAANNNEPNIFERMLEKIGF